MRGTRCRIPLLPLAALLTLFGCGAPAPRPIAYWSESCAHCHMTISDPRYAAQLVTRTGKVYSFDDAACLALFATDGTVPQAEVHSVWVNDFLHPEQRLDALKAVYLERPDLATPMASGLAAFASAAEADSVRRAAGGRILTWEEIARAPHRHPALRAPSGAS